MKYMRLSSMFQRVAVFCSAVGCSVLQCVAMCCSVLQCLTLCVAVCCCVICTGAWWNTCGRTMCCIVLHCIAVLQCVAVCCSVLRCVLECVAVWSVLVLYEIHATVRCVAVCCSVLLCVSTCVALCCRVICTSSCWNASGCAICCSVLQHLAVHCSALQCDLYQCLMKYMQPHEPTGCPGDAWLHMPGTPAQKSAALFARLPTYW